LTKRISTILAALACAAAFASIAGATITATQAPGGPGYQNLSPWNCGGRTFYLSPRYDSNGNQVPQSGLPIRLGFGWGAQSAQNMVQFFQNESGNAAITGADSFSDSWSSTKAGSPPTSVDGITWSDPAPTPLQRPDGTPVSGVGSQYRALLSLTPGTYTLNVNIALAHPVNDGWGTYKGTLSGTCTFNVEQ
jgi:hypothetical protein